MAKYFIPKKLINTSKLLSELDDNQFNELKNFYSTSEPGAVKTLLVSEPKFGLKPSELNNITELVFNLFSMTEEKEPKEEIIEIFNSIVDSAEIENISLQDPERLKQRLVDFILIDHAINTTEKAVRLSSDAQKKVINCSITTDVRPVLERNKYEFSDYLILHNLKIEYRENYNSKEFYFSLTTPELNKLKQAIERAQKKENIITEKLNSIELINLKVE